MTVPADPTDPPPVRSLDQARKDAESLLRQQIPDLGYSVRFDRARRRLGACDSHRKRLSFSAFYAQRLPGPDWDDLIRHEIAHALDIARHGRRRGQSHGDTWKDACREVGADPERLYRGDLVHPGYRWAVVHRETGEVFARHYRRPRISRHSYVRGRKPETLGKLEVVPWLPESPQ